MEFDLSAIPAGATIQSASLTLYGLTLPNGAAHSCLSGDNDAFLRRVTSPWGENTITWNNQPTVTTTGEIYIPPFCTPGADLMVNVTSLVQDMVNDPANSHGFELLLALEDYYRALIFHSSDSPEADKRPKLTVVYEIPCPCKDNIVKNGTFADGIVQGNLGSGGNSNNWSVLFATPQAITHDSCAEIGAMQMWGNQVVGEGVGQSVTFQKDSSYEVTFCGMWDPSVQGDVRIRFRASVGALTNYLNCGSNCDEIFLSPTLATNWATYTSAIWTPTQNYDYLNITIWNNFAINDGAYVSWARIDDVCIRRVQPLAANETSSQLPATLFPNPTSGDVTIEFGEPLEVPAMLVVTDLLGRTLQQMNVESGQTNQSLSLNSYPSGMYVVRVVSGGAVRWTGKVVKE